MPEKVLFVSLADPKKQTYYCKKCLVFGFSPFLCVPIIGKTFSTKIKGCLLRLNSNQEQTQFYGYKCCNCQAKKMRGYFVCSDCDGKENKWCENCFGKISKCSKIGHHNIIFETSPFSFWCESMSANELNHLKFQKYLVSKGGDVFQQAEMYFESHRYEEAIEYYSLYIQQNESKGKNANLATSFNNIGLIYDSQGEYKKALEYYFKSLGIYRSLYGGDAHPDVAGSLNNIGAVCESQGEYKKALEYYLQSLEIRRSIYGDTHHDVAASYNNIGNGNYYQGEYKKALEYHLKSLEIRKLMYGGDNHPEVAASLSNIGIVYYTQEEYKKALEYHLKSLDIRKSMYGDNHPDVSLSYNNIGTVYKDQGEYEKALEYYLKSLDIYKNIYRGDNHPEVAASFINIGTVYKNQGEYEKALEYYLQSLDIRKSIFGENHPVTVKTQNLVLQTNWIY